MTPPRVKVLLDRLFELLAHAEYDEAATVLRELHGQALAPEDAAELVLAADWLPDAQSDARELEEAGRILAGAGRWERAMSAFSAAGASYGADLAGARRSYAAAVGCAEAGSAQLLGAAALLRLAEVEIRYGSKDSAANLCAHALHRLKGVPLLGARADEARAIELLGDLHAASGDQKEAQRHWQDALARFSRLEHGSARRVRAKLGDSAL